MMYGKGVLALLALMAQTAEPRFVRSGQRSGKRRLKNQGQGHTADKPRSASGNETETGAAPTGGASLTEDAECLKTEPACFKKSHGSGEPYEYKTEYYCDDETPADHGNGNWILLDALAACSCPEVCEDGFDCDVDVGGSGNGECIPTSGAARTGSTEDVDGPGSISAYCRKNLNGDGTFKTVDASGSSPNHSFLPHECEKYCSGLLSITELCDSGGTCVWEEDKDEEGEMKGSCIGPQQPATPEKIAEAEHDVVPAYNEGRACCSCHCAKGKCHDHCTDDDTCTVHGAEFKAYEGTCAENLENAPKSKLQKMCDVGNLCNCMGEHAPVLIPDHNYGEDVEMYGCNCACPETTADAGKTSSAQGKTPPGKGKKL